jgi:NAD(P)-dependent dehydrogenase (short-subunit alcohol dehydrogenase family)
MSRVMLTAPVFPSDLAAGLIGDGVFPRERIPLERVGSEEEMAGTILYLTSRAGAYCSGNVMVVDGGRLSVLPSTY